MTKIYCTVAIKLYYRRLRDFSAWNLSRWRSLYHDKLPCGGKTAANMEMMYVILTEAWFYKYIQSVLLLCFMYVWFTDSQRKAGEEVRAFLHSKTSTRTTADRFRSFNPVCLLCCQHHRGRARLTFSSLPLSFPCKMASAWLCHHHKAASHPAWACMFSHVWRALVWIPMWGHVSPAARLILASFCCVVICREAELSWAGGLHAGLMVTKSHQ